MEPGTTYLAEAVYPENRILIHYDETGLMLLAAYEADGIEMPFDRLATVSERLGWKTAKRHQYGSVKELLAIAKKLPASEEGFVLRFSDGQRLKIKGEEYIRIHRMVSRLTPLSMWEAMHAGEDLETIRRQLPEEFWTDFEDITSILERQLHELMENIKAGAESVAGLTDKEVGMRLGEFSEEVKRFIFFYRKSNGDLLSDKRLRGSVFRTFRPDRNILEGYIPSYSVNRLLDENS
ncbi:hypothetical protein FGO68_gene13093 [Halteria grandinella]|uniref:Uncharacterized protein n=1 Tax=Halteria grandinella TaxID=5974 RepID=A0A8J8SUW7_HALGN|nr:hypothetical protein FGO68_gene13093 [Halteria grandinella]